MASLHWLPEGFRILLLEGLSTEADDGFLPALT